MARNLRALSTEDLLYIMQHYDFEARDGYIFVICKHYKRTCAHPEDTTFSISTPVRKVNITADAISLWKENYSEYSLIEVQNAINSLIVTYQDINEENLANFLASKRLEVQYIIANNKGE